MELDPFAYEFHEDPYPTYAWLRENAPLYRNERLGFWALSRYNDVLEASRDWRSYSSREGPMLEPIDPTYFEVAPIMIAMDPPAHTRLRALVSPGFTPRRVAELEESVRKTALTHLEPLADTGAGDFVAEFSALLPMDVIFDMLGIEPADRNTLRTWIDTTLERDPGSSAIPKRAAKAGVGLLRYFYELVEDRRKHPAPGLVGDLVETEVLAEDGSETTRLTDPEIVGFCMLLSSAGNETVTKLLANAVVLFAHHRDEYRKILADRSLIPGAVEEVLRYWAPSQYQGRVAARAIDIHGATIPEGDRVLLLTGSANRDELTYADADRFDIEREAPLPLGLGHGVHLCLGAHLARLEARVALEEFSARFPGYDIDVAGLERAHASNVHGFAHVPFARA